MPSWRKATTSERLARPAEHRRIGLGADARVFEIKRDRQIDCDVAAREVIVISTALFRGLDARQPLHRQDARCEFQLIALAQGEANSSRVDLTSFHPERACGRR